MFQDYATNPYKCEAVSTNNGSLSYTESEGMVFSIAVGKPAVRVNKILNGSGETFAIDADMYSFVSFNETTQQYSITTAGIGKMIVFIIEERNTRLLFKELRNFSEKVL